MALSPYAAQKKALENAAADLSREEERIDAALVGGKRDLQIPRLSPAAQSELLRRYESVGWSVTVTSDVREGSFWRFSVRDQQR